MIIDAIFTALGSPAADGLQVAPATSLQFVLNELLVQAETVDAHAARLTCQVSTGLPAGEDAQRRLLEMHFADVAAGAEEVLWSDAGGALLLSTDVNESDDVPARIASLTDAALAWRARLAQDESPRRPAGPAASDLLLLHRYGGLG